MHHICTYLPDGDLYHDGELYSVLRFTPAGGLVEGRTFPTLAEAHAFGLSLYRPAPRPVCGVQPGGAT